MPTSDKEVFQELTSATEHSEVSNFLTYAIFAFDRRDWIDTFTKKHKREPDQAEIEAWIANLTPHSFDQMRLRAAAFFEAAAQDFMAEDIEAARQETLQGGVLREVRAAVEVQNAGLARTLAEVRSAGSFWKQLGLQTLTSIIAPLLVGGVIAAAVVFSDKLPSAQEVANILMSRSSGDKGLPASR